MSSETLPKTPLYDPKARVLKFKFDQDMDNIRLNIAGTGILFEDPDFYYHLGDDMEWRRPKEIVDSPKFIKGKPSRMDALQGELGDCWIAPVIETITLNDQLFNHVVPPNQSFYEDYIGAFHFRLWMLGAWYDVVVDDRLPFKKKNNKLTYLHSNRGDVFWAALLEKAYAKFWVTDEVTYEVIAHGSPITSLLNFTGGIVEKVSTDKAPSGTTFKNLMNEASTRDALMCCRVSPDDEEVQAADLVSKHVYAITRIFKSADDDPDFHGLFLLRLLNPWGYYEWQGKWSDEYLDTHNWTEVDKKIRKKLKFVKKDDGEFWIDEDDFAKYFRTVWISHLGPGQYKESHDIDVKVNAWKTRQFYGEWAKGVSAGGSDLDTRHKNPQFGIELTSPENTIDRQGNCYVIIQLVHRSKYRLPRPDVAFYVYDTTKIKDPNKKLGKKFFKENEPVNKSRDFKASGGRSSVAGMELPHGRYCIVPCTEKKNEESQFLLRVFTSSHVDQWEYDAKISKSVPKAQESNYYTDERTLSLFNETQDQNEINWSSLQYILNAAMCSTSSSTGFLKYLVNNISFLFQIFFTTKPHNDFDSKNVNFTKDQCRSMIAMLDQNNSGRLNFSEFNELWNKINFWSKVYDQYRDDETSGLLLVEKLQDALSTIGYNINTRTVHSLRYLYDDDKGSIPLTDFILCGVALEAALSRCQNGALENGDNLTFTLEQWVKNTLIL